MNERIMKITNSKLARADLLRSADVAGTSRLPCVGSVLEKRRVVSSGAPAGHPAPVQPQTKNQSIKMSGDLATTNWLNLGPITANNLKALIFTHSQAALNTQRSYRVVYA